MSDWSDWHAQVHQTLKTHNLLPKTSRILIAVSGGQDSLCLLKLLDDLRAKWQWQLGVIHCNHGWRDDATANATHVRSHCQGLELPIWIETAAIPPQGEAAARQWRYGCFTHIAATQGFPIVVTGHTQSDRAETLLYNLIRGSGADGLQSLTWKRSLSSTSQLVRPLLGLTRSETLAFCQRFQLPIWEDATNADPTYARNRIRQSVLPYLTQHFNPQTTAHLAQTAELLQADVAYLEAQAADLLARAHDPTQPDRLNRQVLRDQPLALQRRVIRQFLQAHLPHAPSFAQITAVVALIAAPNRSKTSTIAGGAIVLVCHPYLEIMQLSAEATEF
jgi:tRNA(Ile)-lysidine synthase